MSGADGLSSHELVDVEPDLRVEVVPADLPAPMTDEDAQRKIIDALYATPQGIMRMSEAVPGLGEPSTILGIVQVDPGHLEVSYYLRSSGDSLLDDLSAMISSVRDLASVDVAVSGRYAGWAPNADSPILALMQQVYEEMYGQLPLVSAVQAGLERSTVVAKYPGMDAISIAWPLRWFVIQRRAS